MTLPILTWLLYIFTVTAFVGFVTGIALAALWAVRCAVGFDSPSAEEQTNLRRAITGFRLIVGGILLGGLVVVAAGLAPFVATVVAIRALFGDYPPALAATLSLASLMGIALLVASWFARWWQRLVRIRLEEVTA